MNEGFCDLCRPLFRGTPEGGGSRDGYDGFRHVRTMKQRHRHHKSIQDLVECGKTRCLLCAALWNGISRESQRIWLTRKEEILLEVLLEHENGQPAAGETLTVPPPEVPRKPQGECDSTSSEGAMGWAKDMLQHCELNHEECRRTWTPTPRLPTRLIHLGEPSQAMSPRLVETSGLSYPPQSLPKYTTLSHCWGKAKTLKLTRDTLSRFYRGLQLSEIPKTFADAMAITRSLGVERLRTHDAVASAIDDGPVHRRAWVIQERIMAPRILHFSETMIYWECRQANGCEALGRNIFPTSRASLLGYLYNPTTGTFNITDNHIPGLLAHWATTLNRFTLSSITYTSDKFMAFSAIAREVHRMLLASGHHTVHYLAGLWSLYLEHQLLWRSTAPALTTRLTETTDGITAPSWSWASLHGPLAIILPILPGTTILARVTSYTLTPRSGDPFFGPAAHSKSTLDIEGLLWRLADWARDKAHPMPYKSRRGLTLLWDTAADPPSKNEAKAATYLLPVAVYVPTTRGGHPAPHISGLVLQGVGGTPATGAPTARVKVFVRKGYFEFHLCSFDEQAEWFREMFREGYEAWVTKAIEFCLEDKIIWPSHFDEVLGPMTTAREMWADVTACQSVTVE
ncbi:hypothetical protein N0V88_007263 [Collariella sp. IMI 366227]|nr:hypothetical protein N0V88_007263 [Collariella sp. IMI 366227]